MEKLNFENMTVGDARRLNLIEKLDSLTDEERQEMLSQVREDQEKIMKGEK